MEQELFDFIEKYMPLEEAEKQAFREMDIFRSFPKGSLLLKQGDISNDYYFVLKGCLRVYYVIDGEEHTTGLYTESEAITPLCVGSGKPSEQYLSCVEDSLIIVADLSMEKELFEKFPRFESMCRVLNEKLLAKKQADFDVFKFSSPEERYKHLVKTRPDLLQRVPLLYIASFLGITPESLSRLRRRILEKEKSRA